MNEVENSMHDATPTNNYRGRSGHSKEILSNGDIEKNDFEKLGGLQNYSSHF